MQRETRKLAAIVAADIAGYSRLIELDEEGTLRALRAHRQELIDQLIVDQGGRIVNTAGDSLILEFPSVVDAIRCAIAFQQGMAARNADVPAERRIRFRIGVHVGDVVAEGNDLLGDGVNIAARIEGLADVGGVAISDDAHRQVRDRLPIAWGDSGEHTVKNIARPIRIWRWSSQAPDPAGDGSSTDAPLALPDKPSIAVLAFENMSGDPDQEYFSDGIAEDIITSLSRNRGFFVIARNSSFGYKGHAVDVTRVSRELGVRYILEGSVRKVGNRVRITAQLIDAAHGTHIWAEKYDRELTDVFAVQDEITRNIVATVAPELLEAEMQRARVKNPQILDAWECAMRAQWHLARLTREDNATALRFAVKATELNPEGTLGHNIAAFAHIYDAVYGWSASLPESILDANTSARQAVTLDPRDAVSQTALAATELFMSRHDDAITRLRLAIGLNPNFTWAHGNLGMALAYAGKGEDGMASLNDALRLSPRDQFNFLWLYLLGFAAFIAERYQEALEFTTQSIRENASLPGVHRVRAACLSQLGRIEEARSAIADFRRLAPGATIDALKRQMPFKRPEDLQRYIELLQRAGMTH